MEIPEFGIIYLIVYSIILLLIGEYGRRFIKGKTIQFTIAGRELPTWILSLSLVATTASGITYLGMPGFMYAFGYSGGWYGMYPIIVGMGIIGTYCFSMFVLKTNERTVSGYLGARFRSDLLRATGAGINALQVFMISGQLVAMGWVFSFLLGLPYWIGVLVSSAIAIIYVVAGGFRAVAWTDVIQAAVMICVALLVFFTCYLFLFPGGIAELHDKLALQDPELLKTFSPKAGPLGADPLAVTFMIIPLSFYFFTAQMAKIPIAARRIQDVKFMFYLLALFTLIMTLTQLGGIGARALLGDKYMKTPDAALLGLFAEKFHPALAAFFMLAIFAAILSTVDTVLIALSTNCSEEIYGVWLRKKGLPNEVIEKKVLSMSRYLIIVFAALGTIAALTKPVFLVVLIWIGLGPAMGILGPIVAISSFWKRASKAVTFWTVIVATIIFYILLIMFKFHPFTATGIMCIATIVAYFATTLIVPAKPEEIRYYESILGT